MKYNMQSFIPLLLIIFIIEACTIANGYDKITSTKIGANMMMNTCYIGRFSIEVPVNMKLLDRTSQLRFAEITEIIWPKDVSHEQAPTSEWNNFFAKINKLPPPEGKDKIIITMCVFPGVGQWAKGVYYYYDKFSDYDGRWVLLMDTGLTGVWFKGDSVVEKELVNNLLKHNIEARGKAYTYFATKNSIVLPKGDWFYLKHGAINRPYRSQEKSHARFENPHLNLVLTIDMQMDFRHKIESMGLIEKTRGLLAAAAFQTGGSISKIRLGKREMAGMKGEESILRITEDREKTLLFTWEFNGKEDSGEYPTTTIKMEAPDGNLDEKTKIWDAVLDSMKPMFGRKK
jgi:hypothetical protein